MKKWMYLIAALTAVGILSRLPHPARNIADLEPVQVVYLYMEDGELHIETDTGDHGSGPDLNAAAERMKQKADAELFLDTAEYLLLDPEVHVSGDLFTLLRPACRVCFTDTKPDLTTAAAYLDIHTPDLTLAQLRAERTGR